MNPCPCGFAGDPTKNCLCSPSQIQRYRAKVSGPLLDRIDLHLEVPALSTAELTGEPQGESSEILRQRVTQARIRQRDRFKEKTASFCNAQMRYRHLKQWCRLPQEARELLKSAIQSLGLSARSYDKLLKVSRTIADLDGAEGIQPHHLAEAIQYRSLDRTAF